MTRPAAVLFASALVAGVAAAGVGTGVGLPATAEAPVSLRLLVKLVHPMVESTPADQAEVARQASESAGLPVAYGAAVSADRASLQMACAPAECDAAVQRLRNATGLFVNVERDERRHRLNGS